MLLVEGADDKHVLNNICSNRGLPQLDDVKPLGGVSELLVAIPVQLKASNEVGDVVGVVIDADTDFDARWQSIRDRLTKAGYKDMPAAPDQKGTILEPPTSSALPRVGVWIMPDNRTCGTLECFLQFLVPRPNELLDHAAACVESITDPLFGPNDKLKAIMHTWLAWQAEPGRPYGTAITARFLDPNVPQVDALISWLERLFVRDDRTP